MTSKSDKKGTVLLINLLLMLLLLGLPASGFCVEDPPDTTAPTGSITIEGGEAYSNSRSVSISLSANDPAGSGVSGYYLSENITEPLPAAFNQVDATQTFSSTVSFTLSDGDGDKTLYAWFIDVAGNISNAFSDSIVLDTTAPTGSITIEEGETHTTTRSVSIALSANDAGGSGVAGYYLSENGATPQPASFTQAGTTQTFSSTVSITLSAGDGGKAVHAWFIDAEGNVSDAYSYIIFLDTTAPGDIQISINDASGFVSTSQVTVTLSATDLTGIKGWYLSESPNDPSTALFEPVDPAVTSFNTSVPFTLSKSVGLKTLYVWFIDIFDHMSAPVSAGVDLSYGWVRVQGTEMSDGAEAITMDDNGNIYIAGFTDGDHNDILDPVEAFVSKVSPSGDFIWTGIIDEAIYNTSAENVAVDSHGNVYISGYYNRDISPDLGFLNEDAFIAKFDSNGNRQWLKIYEGDTKKLCRINGLGIDGSNNLYTIGYTSGNLVLSDTVTISYSEGSGNFLAKYDGNGTLLWGKDLYPDESCGQISVSGGFSLDNSGNIYITGTANDGFDGQIGYGSWDILLAKFNSSGEKQWTKLHGTSDIESVYDLSLDSSGNIYISGSVTEAETHDFLKGYIKKFNSSGDAVWSKDILTTETYDNSISPNGVSVDSRGNVYVAGSIAINYGGENSFISKLFLRKYSASGTLLWTKRTPRNDPKAESARGIFIGPGDMVYVAGEIYNYYEGDGFAGQPSYERTDILIWKSAPDSLFDMTHPVAGKLTINNGDATSVTGTVTLNLNASDNIGVTGYAVSEDNTIPPPSAFTLIEETTTLSEYVQYTFEGTATGSKTAYVWYRDAFGNFSKTVSASIEVTGDIDAPVGGTPVIDDGAEESLSTTVSVAISATDNVTVTGYCLTEGYTSMPAAGDFTIIDNPSPDFTKTVSFTLQNTTAGNFTIYVWFIDAAGNISDSVTASGSMKDTRPPVTIIDPVPGYYDGPITITLTATDDSDRYIGDTLFSSVVTKYTINDGDILTYSGTDGTGPFEITLPAVIRYMSADGWGLDLFGANVETVQTATYGVRKVISGEISVGETASRTFSVKAGSDLGILFSLEDGTSLESESRAPLSTECSTTLTLKRPDSSIYGEYTYTEGYTRIMVTGAAAGEWTLEIDRSECATAANFEATLVESPVDGNLPGIPSMSRLIKFLQILSGYDIEGLDGSHDIDGDGKIGIPEAIRMIRDIAEMQ